VARESKPEARWRRYVEARTDALLQRGDIARWDEPGAEYFHRPGQLLVAQDRLDVLSGPLRELKAVQVAEDEQAGVATFALPAGASVHDATGRLQEQAKVGADAVGPHHVMFGVVKWSGCPGRPPFPAAPVQLGSRGKAAPDDGAGVLIAVLDTGQAEQSLRDPWVQAQVTVGQNGVDPLDVDGDQVLDFEAGHGTFIAGVIGQVAPGAKVLALRTLDTDGVTDDLQAAAAVRTARAAGAQILNLSFGGYTFGGSAPVALGRALDDKDVVFVAAAGNDAVDLPFYPAAHEAVVAVAALGSSRRRAAFSNFGPWVDCAAEGERLISAFVNGESGFDSDGDGRRDRFDEPYAYWSGTSFAAPQVAAAIAVRMSRFGETAAQARDALIHDPALPRAAGIGVKVLTHVRSHPARIGLP
jgi:subtilisin family serine protease